MAKIVISYRRADSAGITGRIFDRLTARYGDAVFMDVDNIPLGIDFRKHIRNVLLECDVLLVVVGTRWLGLDQDGKARIHDEDDPVRVEIEAGLQRDIPIIPVLVDGAPMPKASELPEPVKDFAFRNATQIDAGRDFHQQVERLIKAIAQILEQPKAAPAKERSDDQARPAPSPQAPSTIEVPSAPEVVSPSEALLLSDVAALPNVQQENLPPGRPALLQVQGLSKRFGGFVALDGIDLAVGEGERVGLIGPNGSGKSTLVNCICGTLTNETGSVRFDGNDMKGLLTHERTRRGMARSFQLPRPFVSMTVAENLRIPLLYTVNARPGHKLSAAAVDERCGELLGLVGLAGKAGQYPRDLTQVEMRKLELARAMAAEPKLLIADESMAGLSNSEVSDIVALLIRLNERGITIIMIEHIMRAVMSFSQRLIVLVSGKKIADGVPEKVIRDAEVERAYIGQ